MTNPPTALHVNTKYHWLSFMLAGFKPKATINGYEVPLNWGDNVIAAPPGRHNIEIHVPYLWKFGKAATTVDNTAGSPPVYYAAPMWTWQRGAIGLQPQRHPGLTATWVIYVVFGLLLVACCIGVVASGGSGS